MKKATSKSKPAAKATRPRKIAAKSAAASDWRSELLEQIRTLLQQAAPDAVEEIKWRKPSNPGGVPTWSLNGLLCTGETYKDKVKVTFAKGAALKDPAGLFNSSLDGNARRAIDFLEGDKIKATPFKALIRAAVKLNASK
jgi:hypothetical protein